MTRPIRSLLDKIETFAEQQSEAKNRIGLNVFRVTCGCLILLQYLLNYSQRRYLFAPEGVIPWEVFLEEKSGFSLYELSRETWLFESLFHVGIAVTLAWIAGVCTPLLTPLVYLFWHSLHQTNPLLWDGGDNLMQLVLFYACFADLSPLQQTKAPPTVARKIKNIVHNGAVTCFALQLCVVYGVSAMAKIQGETWQNGTALYYALWPEQFRLPGVSELLVHNAAVVATLTYLTVFFQMAFPFLFLLNRRTRTLAVAMGITFHLGIGVVMGLVTFAGFMICAELALISDETYQSLTARITSLSKRMRMTTRALPLSA